MGLSKSFQRHPIFGRIRKEGTRSLYLSYQTAPDVAYHKSPQGYGIVRVDSPWHCFLITCVYLNDLFISERLLSYLVHGDRISL
jgi:hypothetical protein